MKVKDIEISLRGIGQNGIADFIFSFNLISR